MKFNLRNKILTLFVSVALVPLAVFAGLGVYFINLAQKHNIAQLEAQLLTQKEKEIEKFISETQTLLRVQVATQASALSGIPSDQREFLLKEISRANRFISEVAFLEYDASYSESPSVGMELNKLIGGNPSSDLINQKNTPAFARIVEGNDYLGPVLQKNGTFFMNVSAPVRNKDSIIIGATVAELSLIPVERMVREGRLGNTGYLLLADDKGVIWAKPPQLSFQGFNSHVFVQSALGGVNGRIRGETEEYGSSFGTTVAASAAVIRAPGWVLVAEWPKDDAYEVVSSVFNQAIVFLVLLLGITIVVSFLFAGRIIRPVKVLEEGARIIGEGNLNYRIAIHTEDELETLAFHFNEMAKNLKGIAELREIKARAEGLAASLKKEKELSQIKDQFIATASHQLRTPVSVIRWMTEGLRAGEQSGAKEDRESQLKDLSQNVESLALVVGDILTVAELGIGYAPKVVSEFSLREKVKETIDKFASEADAKKLSLGFTSDEKDYRVKASPLNISRALEHVMNNAIIYTKEGGHVLIALSGSEKEVKFSIQDDGIGVPPEDQKFLFGEFFRAKNSVEMKNVGTGLGLFIVKTIIEGHGGKVGVESPAEWDGKKAGSRFYFSLPL